MQIKTFVLFIVLLAYNVGYSKQFSFPYDVVGGKMRVEASINGVKKYFVFDTGGQTTVSYNYFKELGLQLTDSMKITDSSSNKKVIKTARIKDFIFADTNYKIADAKTLVLDEGNPVFDCYDCDGLVGNDIFSRFIVEIDSKTKTITFKTNDEPINISLRNMIKFNEGSVMPVFKINLANGTLLDVLFDSGAKPLIILKSTEYDRLIADSAIIEKKVGLGIESMGVNGMAASQALKKAEIVSFNIGLAKFQRISTGMATPPESLLGFDLLQYGKVTIDYGRSRFYFEPYENKIISQQTKSWNVGLTVRNGRVFVSTLWGKMVNELHVGDEIIEIDGAPVPQTSFCESITKGMSVLAGKDQVQLKVKMQNGEIKTVTSVKE